MIKNMTFTLSHHINLINSSIFIFLLLTLWYYSTLCLSRSSIIRNSMLSERVRTNVTGLILARCGSKGIKMKNLSRINGKSLLQRTINVMVEFGRFNEIWVSTDCQEIADEVERAGARVHWREELTATDHASSILAVREFLQKHNGVKVIALLQCTSPFTKASYLTEAFNKITSGEYDSVFSITRQHKLFWTIQPDGTIHPENFNVENRPRRQDWSGQLVETGMFYFFKTSLVSQNVLQGGRIGYVEVPGNRSLEVDTPFDLQVARAIDNILEG